MNLSLPHHSALRWFSKRTPTQVRFGRDLLEFLGDECKRIYPRTPRVFNELVNRRNPSKAAVAARTKLVDAMVTSSDKPNLGMHDRKRPAEMGLYLSILKEGRFHIERPNGWSFEIPSDEADVCRLVPVLQAITDALKAAGTDALVPISTIFDILCRPPYGVREGLQPLVLAIYLAAHQNRTALYEDGTYLHEVRGDAFFRLVKAPQCFHLQHCELDVVRSDIFAKLLRALKINPADATRTDLMDLVRPLIVFISREVPEYSRKTTSLPATVLAVRRTLLEAREPVRLVFTDLPKACDLPPIADAAYPDFDEFEKRLRNALHLIRSAYQQLLHRVDASIRAAFDVLPEAFSGRTLIATRASQLAAVVTEPTLRAFALRLADATLEERPWLESIANLLARKSAERWGDSDEMEFNHQLELAAGRFKRTELAFIGKPQKLNGHACRIALTKSDGTEVGELVDWGGLDESKITPLQREFQAILSGHGRHGLAAALRALWTQLEEL
jgi:hypothetical protein